MKTFVIPRPCYCSQMRVMAGAAFRTGQVEYDYVLVMALNITGNFSFSLEAVSVHE